MAAESKLFRRKSELPQDVLREKVLEFLSYVRAKPIGELDADGEGDAMRLKSQEIVCVLVLLETTTGIDPKDPEVLKGCNAQELGQFLAFLAAGGK